MVLYGLLRLLIRTEEHKQQQGQNGDGADQSDRLQSAYKKVY